MSLYYDGRKDETYALNPHHSLKMKTTNCMVQSRRIDACPWALQCEARFKKLPIEDSTMRDFRSQQHAQQHWDTVADSSSSATKSAQNLVPCLYQAQLGWRSCLTTMTWNKNLMGQGLSVGIDDSAGKLDIKPWLFSKWRGSKSLEADGSKVEIFWDLSAAKFGSGPETLEGFYVAVMFDREMVLVLGDLMREAERIDREMVLVLGDLMREAERKTNASISACNAVFVAKKEHIFGKKVYCTKARFCENGQVHDVAIECETVGLKDPSLEIQIDKKRVLQVKRLCWKFRGNQTILVDGISVEVFWDVHSWLFGGHVGNAVFMFRSCCSSSSEKLLPWPCSQASKEAQLRGVCFSLVLYAWKSD